MIQILLFKRLYLFEKNGEQIIKVTETGSIVLQARVFNEIVRKLPTNDVEIEVTNQFQTHLRSGKSEFNLIGLDASEYPMLPQIEEERQFSFLLIYLNRLLKKLYLLYRLQKVVQSLQVSIGKLKMGTSLYSY